MRRNWTTVSCLGLTIIFVAGLAPARSEQAKQIICTGKVVDAQGRPIDGAKVSFYQIVSGDIVYTYDVKLMGEVTTEADGAFSFRIAESKEYRRGVITVQKQGLAIGWADWQMREDRQQNITLGEPKQLSGVVVDEDNKPLPDVKVFIATGAIGEKEDEQQYLFAPVARQLLATKTDAAGQFKFVGLPAEAKFEFGMEKLGYATMTSIERSQMRGDMLQFSPGQPNIKLVMPVEAKIKGTIIEQDSGRPVAGVAILVRGSRMTGYFQSAPSISQDNGTFKIDSLLPDTYTLRLATIREGLTNWVAEPVNVTLEAGQTKTDVRIELSKGGFLEVLVAEAETNKPLEGASVYVYDQRRRQSYSGRTGNDGVSRIRLMPGAYQSGNAYKQGFSSVRYQETITIEEGTTKRLEWQLTPLPTIAGVVRDENGKPIKGATLRICPMGGRLDVSSDVEGKFEVSWDPGRAVDQRQAPLLVCRYIEDNLAAVVIIAEGAKALDIKLRPGVTVTGKVVDPKGQGIADARIGIMLRQTMWSSTMTRDSIRTDANGNFEVKAIPVEYGYNLNVSADGYGSKRIDIHADDAVDNHLEVGELTLPLANLAVSGLVVDTQGDPVANAKIESYNYEGGQPDRLTTQTDSQGKFAIDGVCQGKLNIRVDVNRNGKRLSARAITFGGATDIKIIAREGRPVVQYFGTKTFEQIIQSSDKVIAGVAVDENGSPVMGVPVGVCCIKRERKEGKFSWTFSDFSTLRDITDEQGRFAIELEEDAEYNLRFSPDNHAAIIVYDIPVGKKDLKVTLPEGGMVTGRLVRMDKSKKVPIPNVEVNIEQPDRASYTHLGFDRDRTTVTDAEGRFRFEYLRTKIRPHGSMSEKQWNHVARVWEISYGDTSKTIAFYDSTTIEDLELIAGLGPAEAQPLAGKALPGFDGIKIDLAADQTRNKRMLVCFFDMNQRPSRNCVTRLAKQNTQLEQKGVVVIAVHISKVEQAKLDEWIKDNNIPFPVGMIEGDEEQTRFTWGVRSLPWLILTDRKHVVRAEGFGINDLNEKIGSIENVEP